MNAIEKAKDIVAKGAKGDVVEYYNVTLPRNLLPLLRLLVECEDELEQIAESYAGETARDCIHRMRNKALALLDKLRSES